MTDVYLALGSNLGSRHAMLEAALDKLGQYVGPVLAVSDIIETTPWGYESDNNYLNAVARCSTALGADGVLAVTQDIERRLGRTQKSDDGHYSDRTIDIDILYYGNTVIYSDILRVPHPRMWQRDFVVQPLRQIAPEWLASTQRRVAAVGFFDGVHRGHQLLARHVLEAAHRLDMRPTLLTFDRHPQTLFHPNSSTPLLCTRAERHSLLRDLGADIFELRFTSDMASLDARHFMSEVLMQQLNVGALVVGYDHRFGSDAGAGSFELYDRIGQELGLCVIKAPELQDDHVSSSAIRRALSAGDVEGAARMLGRQYTWTGEVVHGQAIGRTLGFPTANLQATDPQKLLPARGVYAVLADGQPAMLNIGTRPTIDSHGPQTVEAHLLVDNHPNLYGRTMTLTFVGRLRQEQRFDSEADLIRQLHEDRRHAEALCRQSIIAINSKMKEGNE